MRRDRTGDYCFWCGAFLVPHRGGPPQHGENNGRSRLTLAQVEKIRTSTESISVLADRYGMGRTTISEIRARKTWRHL